MGHGCFKLGRQVIGEQRNCQCQSVLYNGLLYKTPSLACLDTVIKSVQSQASTRTLTVRHTTQRYLLRTNLFN